VNTDLDTGVPWVSKDGETGLTVPPRSSPELANAVNNLLQKRPTYEAFSSAAKNRVEENFSAGIVAESYNSIYESI